MSGNTKFAEKYGNWAIVTGASAGIGEEFAKQLAERGLNLVLIARRKQKLETLAQTLENQYGIQVRVVALDLSKPDFLDTLKTQTDDLEIGLLVNNAGVYYAGALLDVSLDKQVTMLTLNTRAPLILTHHYAQQMTARGRGGIINISSTVAGFGAPFNANYSATKSYDWYLAEGLAHELRGTGVDVQAFLAGGTFTEGSKRMMGELSPMMKMMMMPPEPVVKTSLNALGKRTVVIPGFINKMMFIMMSRLMPRSLAVRMLAMMMKMLDGGTQTMTDTLANPVG